MKISATALTRRPPAATALPGGESVNWSDFALDRHQPGSGYSYFEGSHKELLELVAQNWEQRRPGVGRENLSEVVVVPMPSARFVTTTVEVQPDQGLSAQLFQRRAGEEPFVRVVASGKPQPAAFAQVVLYSHQTLSKNQEESRAADWEVVSLVASPVENEPMDPVTMMRNMRGKSGGTQVNYTADQLLDSIEFWSRHAKVV